MHRIHTRGVRESEGCDAGAGLDEEAVGVSVVASVELDDLLTLSVGSHQPEHAHARLSCHAGPPARDMPLFRFESNGRENAAWSC